LRRINDKISYIFLSDMKSSVIVIAVLVIAAAAAALFYFLTMQPPVREVKLEAREFGFNGVSGGPTIRMRVGETVKVVLVNIGGAGHEFMTVKDSSRFLNELHETIKALQEKGLEEDEIEKAEEVEMVHHKYHTGKIIVDNEEVADVEVGVGETREFLLRFDEAGTYTYLCAEIEVTFPQTHADKGMLGTIIVEK